MSVATREPGQDAQQSGGDGLIANVIEVVSAVGYHSTDYYVPYTINPNTRRGYRFDFRVTGVPSTNLNIVAHEITLDTSTSQIGDCAIIRTDQSYWGLDRLIIGASTYYLAKGTDYLVTVDQSADGASVRSIGQADFAVDNTGAASFKPTYVSPGTNLLKSGSATAVLPLSSAFLGREVLLSVGDFGSTPSLGTVNVQTGDAVYYPFAPPYPASNRLLVFKAVTGPNGSGAATYWTFIAEYGL